MTTQVPSTWQDYGPNGDTHTFLAPGHTVSAPRIVTFKRKQPALGKDGKFSLSSYEVKFTGGHLDADGSPLRSRSHVTISVQQPVGADITDVQAMMTELGAIMADSAFQNDALVDLMFPTVAPVA